MDGAERSSYKYQPMASDDDIDRLFRGVAEKIGSVDDGTHQMFRLLVETTLKFRDDLRDKEGLSLTVAETQTALDGLMEVLRTHAIPNRMTGHARSLIVKWLEEIRRSVHH